MKRHRTGMTLVELLVVIAIIGVLATLSVWGIASFMGSGSTRDTRVLLGNCTAMLEELRLANNLQGLSTSVIQAPTIVTDGSPDRIGHLAILESAKAYTRMKAMPASRKAMEKLPSDRLLGGPSVPENLKGKLPLDGWGNPILYVPAEGIRGVRVKNAIYCIRSDKTIPDVPSLPAPIQTDKPFFASAGPDGRFDTGDDNLYSFEN